MDFLFPKKCIFCEQTLPAGAPIEICGNCARELPYFAGRYLMESARGRNSTGCDRVVCALKYDGFVRAALSRYKFRAHREYGRPLAALICERLINASGDIHAGSGAGADTGADKSAGAGADTGADIGTDTGAGAVFDCVTCVPLSRARSRERGYNQAAILARHVARYLGSPFADGLLLRDDDALRQSSLGRRERAANARRTFRPAPYPADAKPLDGARVLLVDDIATSLSTLNACAAALKETGAAEVTGAVAAAAIIKVF